MYLSFLSLVSSRLLSPLPCLLSTVSCLLCVGLSSQKPPADDPKTTEEYPRRVLFIQVNHYLYLNPLTTSPPAKNRESFDRFAKSLHVPTSKTNSQLFVLSDNLPPPDERTPTKATVLAGVRQFCQTSRTQDRVLIYFRGHAFERNEKAYFASIEGEVADFNTLIPIAELYELIKASRATQKVVVWDVCPRNPDRPPIRPSSGPMTLELFLALLNAPAGVQAVVPCIPAEHSLEYSIPKGDAGTIPGSAAFDALRKAFEDVPDKNALPTDPIPLVEAFPAFEKHVESAAKALGSKQTAKLMGNLPSRLAIIDPSEPLPQAVLFPVVKTALAAEIKSMFQDLALPPLFTNEGPDPLPTLTFENAILKPYLPDVSSDESLRNAEKYPLRVAVLKALQVIRDTTRPGGPKDPKQIVAINAPISEMQKKNVLVAQAPLAIAIAKLDDELESLILVGKFKDQETKRWQANYDYTLGQVRLRLALLNEYNLILGHVRTESLPELPRGSTGWQLTHTDKMTSKKNVHELVEAARTAFESAIVANKGTPWETLSKRAMLTPPGLRWEPVLK